jgi:hypothetical protein
MAGAEKLVPMELIEFRRKEEMHRLRIFFNGFFSLWGEELKRKENT